MQQPQPTRSSGFWHWSVVEALTHRRFGDLLLFSVTLAEFALLVYLTPQFTAIDWIYVLQHLIVLGIALTRAPPIARDHSLMTSLAVVVSYGYPYAQVIALQYLRDDEAALPDVGLVLVAVSAIFSFVSLLTLGRHFGVRPALRGLTTQGPYSLVRHPLYLSYLISDVGYNLQQWDAALVAIMLAGWASLIYRIRAEERVLAQSAAWADYAASVRYRLIPGIW